MYYQWIQIDFKLLIDILIYLLISNLELLTNKYLSINSIFFIVYLFIYFLLICLFIFFYFFVSLHIYLLVCLFIYLYILLWICLCVYMFIYIGISYPSILSIFLILCISIYLSFVYLPICLIIYSYIITWYVIRLLNNRLKESKLSVNKLDDIVKTNRLNNLVLDSLLK